MNTQVTEPNNSTPTDDKNTEKIQKFLRLNLPTLYTERSLMTVPVSFITLPLIIDKIWKTFEEIGGEPFNKLNTVDAKDIFKKVMLVLAEAKVCCAQRNLQYEDLPQKRQYFHHVLLKLERLVKQLPYPLAIYLDCIGNTQEGSLSITPVLAEIQDFEKELAVAISCAPHQLVPLMNKLVTGCTSDAVFYSLAKQLEKILPRFYIGAVRSNLLHQRSRPSFNITRKSSNYYRLDWRSYKFWFKSDKRFTLLDEEMKSFHKIVECFNNIKDFNVQVDLLNGKGSMAQTVQMTEWFIDRPFRYFCMADISEYDQKLGAMFGFGFRLGYKVQESRYNGSFETAYLKGEISPQMMWKSILDYHQEEHELKGVLDE